MNKRNVLKLVLAGFYVALGVLLPIIFHWFQLGKIFLPMHIPVLLCGLMLGPYYGGLCGAVVPLLSYLLTNMPPVFFPVTIAMMVELCAYGVLAGLFIKKTHHILALILAMVGGRIIGVAALAVLLLGAGMEFVLAAELVNYFVAVWPGILIQVIAIPAIMEAVRRAKFPLIN